MKGFIMKSTIKNMGITRNDKQADGTFKRVFTTDISFTIDYDTFPKTSVQEWTNYGFKVMLQGLLRKFDRKEQILEWLNKHSGIVTPEAVNELSILKAPPKDPSVAYLAKVSKLEGDKQQEEIAKMIEQLKQMQTNG